MGQPLSGSNARGYKNIVALAAKNGWKLLQLFCASRAVALQESGASYNSLGIARVGVDLPALAFKAYSKAADLGVSVALCNKSSILANSGNNGAALEILSSYQGEFDAADPGMPYELRARMERAVKQERDKEAELLERGRRQLQALWTIAAQALRTRATEIAQPNGRLGGILNPINIQEGKCPPIGLLAQYAAARLEAS